jgi:hypothetical protein
VVSTLIDEKLGNTEVNEFQLALVIAVSDQNIVEFEVIVDVASQRMEQVQGLNQLDAD